MKTKTIIFTLLMTMICFKSVMGQGTQNKPEFYNWFDNHVNRFNTGLFNGLEYIEQYRTINERHKFFESSEFKIGTIVYDGQFYDKVLLKYDLNEDKLLFNVGYNYPFPTLIMFTSKVNSFSLGESDFININHIKGEQKMTGFYELLMVKEPLTLLKKNKKKRFKRIKGNTVYYEFDQENSYIVKYHGDFYEVKVKKDVIRIWPEKKQFINEYFNPALQKTNEDEFWKNFFYNLADTVTTKSDKEHL